jgi:uncharacterized protein YmfQ (DUF2313 family)
MRAGACALAEVHERARDLDRELDPRGAEELLPEWEAFLGLPDACVGEVDGLSQRRAAVVSRIAETGGQTPEYFVELAARFGFEVQVVEHVVATTGWATAGQAMETDGNPALCGTATCGDQLGLMLGWSATWDVVASNFSEQAATAGSSVGLPLRTWGNALLECVIRRAAPAHTLVRFLYHTVLRPEPAVATLSAPGGRIIR